MSAPRSAARSAARTAVASLTDAVEAETAALIAGGHHPGHAAAKSALLNEVERRLLATPGDIDRASATALREAAMRNRAALETARRAAAGLLDDLRRRLALIDSDGTYRRSDLAFHDGLRDPPAEALPAPDAG